MPGDIFSQHILVYTHTAAARSWYLLGTAKYSFYTVLHRSAEYQYVIWLVDWSSVKDPFASEVREMLRKMYYLSCCVNCKILMTGLLLLNPSFAIFFFAPLGI